MAIVKGAGKTEEAADGLGFNTYSQKQPGERGMPVTHSDPPSWGAE